MGKQNVFKSVCSVFIVILGNVLYALAVKLFLIPAGLVTGGTTGYIRPCIQCGDAGGRICGVRKAVCTDDNCQHVYLSDCVKFS